MRRMRLRPHQIEWMRRAKRWRSLPLWAWMRLGKTIFTIRWIDSRPNCDRVLVSCPLSVVPAWVEELEREGHKPVQLIGVAEKRAEAFLANTDKKWFIINREGLTDRGHRTRSNKPKAVPSEFSKLPWHGAVIDESTSIKNPKAQITKVALEYLSRAKYKVCLSGLPNPEGPQDFVTQMIFLRGDCMGHKDFWTWRQEFMQPASYGGWVPKRESVEDIYDWVRDRSITMTKKDARAAGIGSRLIRQRRYVKLPQRIYNAMQVAKRDFELPGMLTDNALTVATWLSRLAGGRFPDPKLQHNAKMRELGEVVSGELRDEPIVVWARFTDEIMAAYDQLKRDGVSVDYANGKTTRTNPRKVARFQNGKTRVLICQTKCFKQGVNFSVADTHIHLSRYYDFDTNAQSDERTDHIDKNLPRLCIDIVANDTIDETLARALAEKNMNARRFAGQFLKTMLDKIEAERKQR